MSSLNLHSNKSFSTEEISNERRKNIQQSESSLTDCHFYLTTYCAKGNLCPYRHEESLRASPNTPECKYWLNYTCWNVKCPYRHPPRKADPKSTICWFYVNKHCSNGAACPFIHPRVDKESKRINKAKQISLGDLDDPEKLKETLRKGNRNIPLSQLGNLSSTSSVPASTSTSYISFHDTPSQKKASYNSKFHYAKEEPNNVPKVNQKSVQEIRSSLAQRPFISRAREANSNSLNVKSSPSLEKEQLKPIKSTDKTSGKEGLSSATSSNASPEKKAEIEKDPQIAQHITAKKLEVNKHEAELHGIPIPPSKSTKAQIASSERQAPTETISSNGNEDKKKSPQTNTKRKRPEVNIDKSKRTKLGQDAANESDEDLSFLEGLI